MAIDAQEQTARKGILKQLQRQGGSEHIRELHEFSTLRFGRGHQAFSLLMEGLVADGLVEFEEERFALTAQGREACKGLLL